MLRDSPSNVIACPHCAQPVFAPFTVTPYFRMDINAQSMREHKCSMVHPLRLDLAPYCRECRNAHPRTMTCTEARQR